MTTSTTASGDYNTQTFTPPNEGKSLFPQVQAREGEDQGQNRRARPSLEQPASDPSLDPASDA